MKTVTEYNSKLQYVENLFIESIKLKQLVVAEKTYSVLLDMADVICESIEQGGKLLICGNGGSAADAQHLAAELLVRLRPHVNRQGIGAIALAMDSSTITACGNDFGYECMFERMTQALGRKGDVLLGITTSGNSANVNLALKAAKDMGVKALSFSGGNGGETTGLSDLTFLVPSHETGRIQESHITAGHALMELIEDKLLESGYINQ